jgi:hypothetical protein
LHFHTTDRNNTDADQKPNKVGTTDPKMSFFEPPLSLPKEGAMRVLVPHTQNADPQAHPENFTLSSPSNTGPKVSNHGTHPNPKTTEMTRTRDG